MLKSQFVMGVIMLYSNKIRLKYCPRCTRLKPALCEILLWPSQVSPRSVMFEVYPIHIVSNVDKSN